MDLIVLEPKQKMLMYSIRTKAKDVDGKESGWSVLEISMPKRKIVDNLLFEQLLTRFPFLKNLYIYANY